MAHTEDRLRAFLGQLVTAAAEDHLVTECGQGCDSLVQRQRRGRDRGSVAEGQRQRASGRRGGHRGRMAGGRFPQRRGGPEVRMAGMDGAGARRRLRRRFRYDRYFLHHGIAAWGGLVSCCTPLRYRLSSFCRRMVRDRCRAFGSALAVMVLSGSRF